MSADLPPSFRPDPAPRGWRRYWRWLAVGFVAAALLVLLVPALQYKLLGRVYRVYRHWVMPPAGSGDERTPPPPGFAVRGVDVSAWQAEIDWAKVAGEPGLTFAFLKATEGRSWVDPYFSVNWDAARAAGLKCGAYHFYRPNRDATQQANLFVAQVKLGPGDLPPVLDVEKTDGRSVAEIRRGVGTWLKLAERHYGVKPIIYTNHRFYLDYFAGHFDQYPLWLAHYRVPEPRLQRERWNFWQHSDEALVPGIRGWVDGNVFNGSARQFAQLLIPPPKLVEPKPLQVETPVTKPKATPKRRKRR